MDSESVSTAMPSLSMHGLKYIPYDTDVELTLMAKQWKRKGLSTKVTKEVQ